MPSRSAGCGAGRSAPQPVEGGEALELTELCVQIPWGQADDQAINTVGFARGRSQREVERYCVSPGQACSYKIGHAAWLRARDNAKRIAGAKFDIRHFHDVLESGAMPLSMLERIVAERARAIA